MTDDLVGRLRADAVWRRKLRGGTTNEAMLDEAAARIEALEAALIQARSDFHLLMLGTVSNETFHEAKAARDRVHAALTPEPPHAD